MESNKYVSSRGLLHSCVHHLPVPQSSSADIVVPAGIEEGDTIYVSSPGLSKFIDIVLPTLEAPFILVTGDADDTMPSLNEREFFVFIENPLLLHWYSQNLTISHPKMSHIPIGLDYHTIGKPPFGEMHPWGPSRPPASQEAELIEIIELAARTRPAAVRQLLAYSSFHHATFGINTRGDRAELLTKVPHPLIWFEPQFADRRTSWINQTSCAFVLSPRGGGYDCHRTWEAMVLGCIPIVKHSGLDPLFADLPVLIVRDWSDLTADLLARTREDFAGRTFNLEKLTLSYWVAKFNSHKKLNGRLPLEPHK